jgi:hypothetical protein
MGDVFVGSMCAIGVFPWSYKGYDWRDATAGSIIAVCAIGIALFPTAPDTGGTASQITIGNIHTWFAANFFLTLPYFLLVLFRKNQDRRPPNAYEACA